MRYSLALLAATALAQPPVASKHPVTDTYHGIEVLDDYRWLETASDPAVKQWSDAENAYARKHLDALPGRPAVAAELEKLYRQPTPSYYSLRFRGGLLFA